MLRSELTDAANMPLGHDTILNHDYSDANRVYVFFNRSGRKYFSQFEIEENLHRQSIGYRWTRLAYTLPSSWWQRMLSYIEAQYDNNNPKLHNIVEPHLGMQ